MFKPTYAAVTRNEVGDMSLTPTFEGLLAITDNKKQLQRFCNRMNIMYPEYRCTVELVNIQLVL